MKNLVFKKGEVSVSGFTLAELLVVVVIISILGSLATLGLSSQISKARRVEATLGVNACQKEQKAYYVENLSFALTLNALGLPMETENFIYGTEISEPDTSQGERTTIACCMAAEKVENGQMLFACVADN